MGIMLRWIQQLNPHAPTKCDACRNGVIPAGIVYWRACANQDGVDESGYNCCRFCAAYFEAAGCHKPLPKGAVIK